MFDEFVLTLRWIGDLMCMFISVCFCASVNASMTQLGGCLSLVEYQELGGPLRYLSDHS